MCQCIMNMFMIIIKVDHKYIYTDVYCRRYDIWGCDRIINMFVIMIKNIINELLIIVDVYILMKKISQ